MEDFNLLSKLRKQIDNIDEEILILLKRRFQTVKKVAKYKIENKLNIEDKNRENNLILEKIAKSKIMQIDEKFIKEIYELIITESKKIQNKYINKNNKK